MIHYHPLSRLQAGPSRLECEPQLDRPCPRANRSTSARGKSSIIPTPTETPSITTSEHHGDGSQDASDAGNSHGGSYTLKARELTREALKIVNNADSAELMILELMDKYSFSFSRLKELLKGKLVTPFLSHQVGIGINTTTN